MCTIEAATLISYLSAKENAIAAVRDIGFRDGWSLFPILKRGSFGLAGISPRACRVCANSSFREGSSSTQSRPLGTPAPTNAS